MKLSANPAREMHRHLSESPLGSVLVVCFRSKRRSSAEKKAHELAVCKTLASKAAVVDADLQPESIDSSQRCCKRHFSHCCAQKKPLLGALRTLRLCKHTIA